MIFNNFNLNKSNLDLSDMAKESTLQEIKIMLREIQQSSESTADSMLALDDLLLASLAGIQCCGVIGSTFTLTNNNTGQVKTHTINESDPIGNSTYREKRIYIPLGTWNCHVMTPDIGESSFTIEATNVGYIYTFKYELYSLIDTLSEGSSGTYTVPTVNEYKIFVSASGGGGGGGSGAPGSTGNISSAYSKTGCAGGGGGGANFIYRALYPDLTSGSQFNYSVGIAGSAGIAPASGKGTTGGTGGTTTVGNLATLAGGTGGGGGTAYRQTVASAMKGGSGGKTGGGKGGTGFLQDEKVVPSVGTKGSDTSVAKGGNGGALETTNSSGGGGGGGGASLGNGGQGGMGRYSTTTTISAATGTVGGYGAGGGGGGGGGHYYTGGTPKYTGYEAGSGGKGGPGVILVYKGVKIA